MKRRRSAPPDSLELLLDTLCNTFGGVLFISMLVVVLLQLSGKSSGNHPGRRVSSAGVEDRRATLDSLRTEIDSLRETFDKQTVLVDPGLAKAIRDRHAETERLSRRHADLARNRDRSLLDLSGREVSIRKGEEALAELADTLEQAMEEKIHAEDDLARERKARTRSIQAPSLKETRKESIALEVRYGRLYILHAFGPGNVRIGPNLEDYVILAESADGLSVRPNPAAGLPIRKGDTLKQALAQRLARFPTRTCYLDIIARTDSFEIFGDLRSALSELGYEVGILPVATDDPVIDRGGAARGVQ
ncbi:MAG: hypothetical protein JWN86_788 [Planctomycetota bacterium]|nr:hypothetical protein [Planctomycetota bacterium]